MLAWLNVFSDLVIMLLLFHLLSIPCSIVGNSFINCLFGTYAQEKGAPLLCILVFASDVNPTKIKFFCFSKERSSSLWAVVVQGSSRFSLDFPCFSKMQSSFAPSKKTFVHRYRSTYQVFEVRIVQLTKAVRSIRFSKS